MNDDANAPGPAPLTASVGEQLREKVELERKAAEARDADERRHEGLERRKAQERAEVLGRSGDARAWKAYRAVARRSPTRRRPTLRALATAGFAAAAVVLLWRAARAGA